MGKTLRNEGMKGKKILVIFEDGANFHVSSKTGICTNNNDTEITLDNRDVIPKHRIIRIQILGGDSHGN